MLEDLAPLWFLRGLGNGAFISLVVDRVPSVGLRILLKKEFEALVGRTFTVDEWNQIRGAAPVTSPVPDLPAGPGDDDDQETPCDAARREERDAVADRDAALEVFRAWQDIYRRATSETRRFYVEPLDDARSSLAIAAQAAAAASRARRLACGGL